MKLHIPNTIRGSWSEIMGSGDEADSLDLDIEIEKCNQRGEEIDELVSSLDDGHIRGKNYKVTPTH